MHRLTAPKEAPATGPSVPEEWLHEFLESQLGAVFFQRVVDEHGTVHDFQTIYQNAGAEKIAPFYKDLVLDETGTLLDGNGEPAETLWHQLVRVWKTGTREQNRFFHPATSCYYRIVCSRLKQDVLVVAYDITGEIRDKLEVERLAHRLQTVISTSQSGVHIFKPEFDDSGEVIDFRMMMVNKTIGDYIGQTVETLTGALASTFFPAYKTNGLFEIYKDCYLTGTRHHFDFHYEDGYNVFFNLLVVKLGDEVLVTLTDHTYLKRMQREMEAFVAELKRSNASLEQFAHASSHDLQEPLRKIIVYADKLLTEHAAEMNDTCYGHIERIRTASKRMHRLVKDLLVFAEVGANKNPVEEVDLDAVVNDVLNDLEVSIAERDARIITGSLGKVKGDSLHLHQLFQNLVSNSLKYARHGVQPVVTITSKIINGDATGLTLTESEQEKQWLLLELKDNGQGFSAEESSQIFKIFQRLPQHRTEQSGTGIGLAIVQRVVENHKGYITAEGVPEEGATFRVYLPLAPR